MVVFLHLEQPIVQVSLIERSHLADVLLFDQLLAQRRRLNPKFGAAHRRSIMLICCSRVLEHASGHFKIDEPLPCLVLQRHNLLRPFRLPSNLQGHTLVNFLDLVKIVIEKRVGFFPSICGALLTLIRVVARWRLLLLLAGL